MFGKKKKESKYLYSKKNTDTELIAYIVESLAAYRKATLPSEKESLQECLDEFENIKLYIERHLYAGKKLWDRKIKEISKGIFECVRVNIEDNDYEECGYYVSLLVNRHNFKNFEELRDYIWHYYYGKIDEETHEKIQPDHRKEIWAIMDASGVEDKQMLLKYKTYTIMKDELLEKLHIYYTVYKNRMKGLPVFNENYSFIDENGKIIERCLAEDVPSVAKYLKKRGVTEEQITDWGIGKEPGDYDVIRDCFSESCEAALRRYPYSETEKKFLRDMWDYDNRLNNFNWYTGDINFGWDTGDMAFSNFDFYMDYFEESLLTRRANSYEEFDAYRRLCEDYAGKELPIKQERLAPITKIEEIGPTEDDRRQFIVTRADGTVMKGACRYYTKKIDSRIKTINPKTGCGYNCEDLRDDYFIDDEERRNICVPSKEYLKKEAEEYGPYIGYIKSFSKELRYENGEIYYVDIDRDNRRRYDESEKPSTQPTIITTRNAVFSKDPDKLFDECYYNKSTNTESLYGKNNIGKYLKINK